MSKFLGEKVPGGETKNWNPMERSQRIWKGRGRGKGKGSGAAKPDMGIEVWKGRKIIEYEAEVTQEKMQCWW